MTSTSGDPVGDGVSAAQQRLQQWGVGLSIDAVEPTIITALQVLRESGVPTPPRALEMVIELTTIAAMMRARSDEPALTADEIGSYIEQTRGFLNIWSED